MKAPKNKSPNDTVTIRFITQRGEKVTQRRLRRNADRAARYIYLDGGRNVRIIG